MTLNNPGGNNFWVTDGSTIDKAWFILFIFNIVFATATLSFLLFTKYDAKYGKLSKGSQMKTFLREVGPLPGWVLMEFPSCVLFIVFFLIGFGNRDYEWPDNVVPWVLLGIWQAHYVQRTFIYPWLARSGANISLDICLMGAFFNTWNSFLNAFFITYRATYPISWLYDPRFVIGLSIFIIGYAINRHSDAILISLRKKSATEKGQLQEAAEEVGGGYEGKDHYQIPHGGMFRFVSCPNYLGEELIWIGWAILSWSVAGLAFAFMTAANLFPRAKSQHKWYNENFGTEYPSDRKAVIPLIY